MSTTHDSRSTEFHLSPEPKKNTGRTVLLALVALLLVGFGVYYLVFAGDDAEPAGSPTTPVQQSPNRPQLADIEAAVQAALTERGYTQEDLDNYLGDRAPALNEYVTCMSQIASDTLSDESLQTFMDDPLGFDPTGDEAQLADMILEQCTVKPTK